VLKIDGTNPLEPLITYFQEEKAKRIRNLPHHTAVSRKLGKSDFEFSNLPYGVLRKTKEKKKPSNIICSRATPAVAKC
jgi:hypothetical protein